MSLAPGTKLAGYEIVGPIGAGGMGEVYRAHDTMLGRDVAIKTLPEELADDADRLTRFDREARLLASLNHPKIATLHGLDEADGTRFLVMELVDGETLADRLERGPLSLERALDIARQIAEALEAAHEKGVIHRDLKPGNIMVLADDGDIKVLDFGLAKAFATQASDESAELSHSPTLTRQGSVAGVIVGTASYMSPEQARGKSVDKRSDIFAFGSVLFEMLTGQKAFAGDDISDVLASVIKLEPDWNALAADIPPRIRELLHRCLKKDPKSRRRDIGDVRLEIEELLRSPPPESEPAPVARAVGSPVTVIAFLAFGLVAGLAAWSVKPAPPPPSPMAFEHVLPEGQSFSVNSSHFLAVSPDGTRIVYAAENQLYMRSLDATDAVPIRGTEGDPRSPVFSPDSQWIGFIAANQLRKVAAAGGAAVKLCDVPRFPNGANWANGSILFVQPDMGIMRVPETGGEAEVIVAVKEGERLHGPQMLPSGQRLLFTRGAVDWDDSEIVVHSLESGDETTVVARGTDGRYLPTGHILYAVANTVFAVAFDLVELEVRGVPVPVVENVRRATVTGGAQLSVSDTGMLAYIAAIDAPGTRRIVWVDRSGQVTPARKDTDAYREPRFSPDGARLAIGIGDDLWIHEIGGGTSSRFTTEGVHNYPVWSPDGASLWFASNSTAGGVISHRRSDFSSEPESTGIAGLPFAWTPDSKVLVLGRFNASTGMDIWALPSDGDAQPVVQGPPYENSATLSPNGKWIAFSSSESGRNEIYVQPFPGPGRRTPVSTNGGRHPVWSQRGDELFYVEDFRRLLVVDVGTEPEFRIGQPTILFEKSLPRTLANRQYDVSPDGQRFVMVEGGSQRESRQQVNIVLNWFQELERLAPSK